MHRWSEGDDLVALYRFRFGTAGLPYSIEEIAKRREIGVDSLKMRVRNFKAVAGQGGLSKYAKQTEAIYLGFRRRTLDELRRVAFPEL